MNVTAAQRDPVIVALILVLRIKADIGVFVGLRKCRRVTGVPGAHPRDEHWRSCRRFRPRASDCPSAVRRPRASRAPIEPPGRIEWIGAQIVQRVGTERGVGRRFKVERVVDERVGARAADMSRKSAIDYRGRSESVAEGRNCIGERPSRRRIPRVLHGGIVVGRDAVCDRDSGESRLNSRSGYRCCPSSTYGQTGPFRNLRPGGALRTSPAQRRRYFR